MIAILSILGALAAGAWPQSDTLTPIALQATKGAWLGIRNESDNQVEVCDLSVSVQASRRRGTVGRVSGTASTPCEALSEHALVEPHESHFTWIDVPFRSSSRVTVSLRVVVFDAIGKPRAPVSLMWHDWTKWQVDSPVPDDADWRGSAVTYRGSPWIRVTNHGMSPRAMSLNEDTRENRCSSGRRFHLVLPGQSLVQGKIAGPKSLTIFEADPTTGRCLRGNPMPLSLDPK